MLLIRRLRNLYTSLRGRPGRAFLVLTLLGLIGLGMTLAVRYARAELSYRAALAAMGRRDFAEARARLETCLRVWPQSPRVLLLAAREARCSGRLGEAEEHLAVCQRLHFNSDALALEEALLSVQRGNLAPFEQALQARAERDDEAALLILEVLIDVYVQNYRLRRAFRYLNLYLRRRPEDVQALVGRGRVCERLFYYVEAADSYRRAVRLEPGNEQIRLLLAEVLLIIGPPAEARKHFTRLQQTRPQDPAVLLGLARSQRQEGHTKEAVRLLERLLSRQHLASPADPPADTIHAGILHERGLIALEAGELAEAEQWLRQAVTLAPSDRQATYNLHQCLLRQGKEVQARECLARLTRLDEDLKRIARVTERMQLTPGDPSLYHEAGVLFLRNGNESEGLRWLHLALAHAPAYRPAHETLADFYRRRGNAQLAEQHRRLAQQTPESVGP